MTARNHKPPARSKHVAAHWERYTGPNYWLLAARSAAEQAEAARAYRQMYVEPGDPHGCILLGLYANRDDYRHIKIQGKSTRWHIWSYMICRGPVESGLVVMHAVCDRNACGNPYHLETGTQSENMRRMYDMGRGGKLTKEDAADIRARRSAGESAQSIADAHDITRGHVYTICSGKSRGWN